MPFYLSPVVNVIEKDFSLFIPAVSTSIGALVGDFAWGPINTVTTLSNIQDLEQFFGRPTDRNYKSWFSAYNFLQYTNALRLVRTAQQTSAGVRPYNASDAALGATDPYRSIGNELQWETTATKGTNIPGNFLARYPGAFGNRISIAYRDGRSYTAPTWVLSTAITTGAVRVPTNTVTSPYRFVATTTGTTAVTEPTWPTALGATVVDGTVTWRNAGPAVATWDNWTYKGLFPFQPASVAGVRDEFALVVLLDSTVVETFIFDAVRGRLDDQSQPNYAGDFVFRFSKYLHLNDERLFTGFTSGTTTLFSPNYGDLVTLALGTDGDTPSNDDYIQSWTDTFANAEEQDINLIITGEAAGDVARHVVNNIAEVRKDVVAFLSPAQADVVGVATPVTSILARVNGSAGDNLNLGSSYAFMDGNYKYQFDQYNDKYRWVPLNGDMAGLAAATDNIADPWWSFAGFNRGIIKNVVKLAFNPTKAQRDDLYVNSVNPVIMSRGEGAVLYGDRTMLRRPSAFRAVNVRRLFIVIEKAIATAAKYQLFEFNDVETREAFVQMVNPYLRDVQGRRGIIDFLVVADERINTPEVIDRQEFKALILIKPNRSINFIELTFAATKTGAVFEELIPTANGNE